MEIHGNRLTYYDTFSERDLEPDRRRGYRDGNINQPPSSADEFSPSEWEVISKVRADLADFMQEVHERRAQHEEERDTKEQRVFSFNGRREVMILELKARMEALRREKGDSSPRYLRAKEEFEDAQDAHRTMAADVGRPLSVYFGNWIFYAVFAVLSIAEVPVNFPAIQQVFLESTIFAALLAVVLGLLLMFLAHTIGRVGRQFPHAIKNGQGTTFGIFLALPLVVSVWMVWLLYKLRVAYLIELSPADTVSIEQSGLLFLLFNLAVVLAGIVVSFFHHDPNPDYQNAAARADKARKKFNTLREAFETSRQELQRAFDIRTASLAREVERLEGEVEVSVKSLANLERQKIAFIDRVLMVLHLRLMTYQSTNKSARNDGTAPGYFGEKRIKTLIDDLRLEFMTEQQPRMAQWGTAQREREFA